MMKCVTECFDPWGKEKFNCDYYSETLKLIPQRAS